MLRGGVRRDSLHAVGTTFPAAWDTHRPTVEVQAKRWFVWPSVQVDQLSVFLFHLRFSFRFRKCWGHSVNRCDARCHSGIHLGLHSNPFLRCVTQTGLSGTRIPLYSSGMDEHVAQRSASGLNMDETTRESAYTSYPTENHPSTYAYSRVSGSVGFGGCLFPPTWVAFLKARLSGVRRSARRNNTPRQEDFRRDVCLILPSARGSDDRKEWAVAIIDTGSDSYSFISEHLVHDFHGFIRYNETSTSPLSRVSVRVLDGSELEILGEVTLRWKGEDKRCRNKAVFMHPKYFTTKFLVVPSRQSADVVIGLQTFQDERLNEEHPTCWYNENLGGNRPNRPQVSAERVIDGERQRQQVERREQEVDEAAAESEDDKLQEQRLKKKKQAN